MTPLTYLAVLLGSAASPFLIYILILVYVKNKDDYTALTNIMFILWLLVFVFISWNMQFIEGSRLV